MPSASPRRRVPPTFLSHTTTTSGGKPSLIFQTTDGGTTSVFPSAGARLKVTAAIPGLQPVKRHRGNQGEERQ